MLGGKNVSCSSVLPLLSALTKHMAVHDDDLGYIASFKAAALDDFQARVTGINAVELLRLATALEPRYKTFQCLSAEEKDETWLVIEAKLPTAVDSVVDSEQSAYEFNCSEYDTVCQPQNKRMRLMDQMLTQITVLKVLLKKLFISSWRKSFQMVKIHR